MIMIYNDYTLQCRTSTQGREEFKILGTSRTPLTLQKEKRPLRDKAGRSETM